MDKLKRDILNLVDGESYVYALICNSTYWSNGLRDEEMISGLYLHQEIAEKECQIKIRLAKEDYERKCDSGDYTTDSFSVEKFYINWKETRKNINTISLRVKCFHY